MPQHPQPDKLNLYRLAVQHAPAEVAFLQRAFAHHNDGELPTLLREDFCGTAAIAAHFVALDENHRAVAIDSHYPTHRWALQRWPEVLGERAQDLHLVCDDVLSARTPRVDVVAALNFSVFIYHDRPALLNYFKTARKTLRPGGLLVIDAYGGPGAMQVKMQKRQVVPDASESVKPFEYQWEQRNYDAVTSRVDSRIHFGLSKSKTIRDAFLYDWRLWSLTELVELLTEAGFASAQVWCDADAHDNDAAKLKRASIEPSPRWFAPLSTMPGRDEWVAYVVAVAPRKTRRG